MMSKHILVLDDEEELADLIASQLEFYGFETTVYNNPLEAKEFLQTNSVDLIISDIRMPEMTGDKFYLALKEELQTSTPPIIFITGFAEISKDDAIELGAKTLIHKPFEMKTLKENLDDVFA